MKKSNGKLKMIVTKKSHDLSLSPEYDLHLLQKNSPPVYLCSAKMPSNNSFLVSSSPNDFTPNGVHYVGKVKGNFSGSEYNVFGPG